MCPNHHYECSKCGHAFDELQDLKDKVLTYCIHCDADTLEKLITGNHGVHLKGECWAKDGYKSTNDSVVKNHKRGKK